MPSPYATVRDFYAYLKAEAIVNASRRVKSADPATDRILAPGHGLFAGDVVRFELGGATVAGGTPALPAPLTEFGVYYALPASGDLFAVAATPGGSAIDLTMAGAGLFSFVQDMEATIALHLAQQAARVNACLVRRGVALPLLGEYPEIASLVIRLAVWPVLLARGYTTGRNSDPDQDYKALWEAAEEEREELCAGEGKPPWGLPVAPVDVGLSTAWDLNARGWTPLTPEGGI